MYKQSNSSASRQKVILSPKSPVPLSERRGRDSAKIGKIEAIAICILVLLIFVFTIVSKIAPGKEMPIGVVMMAYVFIGFPILFFLVLGSLEKDTVKDCVDDAFSDCSASLIGSTLSLDCWCGPFTDGRDGRTFLIKTKAEVDLTSCILEYVPAEPLVTGSGECLRITPRGEAKEERSLCKPLDSFHTCRQGFLYEQLTAYNPSWKYKKEIDVYGPPAQTIRNSLREYGYTVRDEIENEESNAIRS